jgi:NAD(P)H-hydrate epimerase
VLVDGVFGTGLERPIEGGRAEALARLATCGVPSFALDLPSGVDADEGTVLGVAWPASVTATFGAHKRGLHQHPGAALAGEVVVVSLGVPVPSPSRTVLLEASDLVPWVPARAAHTHKGMAGHVTVFGGSPGRTGAALLAGLGAMRSGAGLVTLAPRGNVRAALDAKVVELMTTEIPEALEAGIRAALTEAEGRSSCVVGPGLGLDSTARSYALRLALGLPVPTVLDADALTALGSDVHTLRAARGTRVLTPHPGEAARLLGCSASDVQAGRHHAAETLAARCGQVVVLKGAGTIIASPDGRVAVSRAGTPALGVAGTGDVLAGVVASMLVSLPPFEAACAAVLAHGRAGEMAAEFDRGLLAREVADALPRALAAGRMGR